MLTSIVNEHGEFLDMAWSSGSSRRHCLVILGHGVTANKDRDWAQSLARGLDQAGFACLRFSFSGNGRSQGNFQDSTISKEVADLGAVLGAVSGYKQIVFVGHSMGGAVGVLRAAEDERISTLVSLAGMVHVHDFAQRKFGELTPGQDLMWDKPECPLSQGFMDDMARLNSVVELGANIKQPWLLVHGSDDTVVPLRDSEDIVAQASHVDVRLEIIDDANHLFSGAAEEVMVKTVVDWLSQRVTEN